MTETRTVAPGQHPLGSGATSSTFELRACPRCREPRAVGGGYVHVCPIDTVEVVPRVSKGCDQDWPSVDDLAPAPRDIHPGDWHSHARWWRPSTWFTGHIVAINVREPGEIPPPCACCGALHPYEHVRFDPDSPPSWGGVETRARPEAHIGADPSLVPAAREVGDA